MAQIQDLRRLKINQSMTKPILMLGCDRILLISSGMLCFFFGFNYGLASMNIPVFLLMVGTWLVISFGLRKMAKVDPELREVFQRYTRYGFKYPARSEVLARPQSSLKQRWVGMS